MQIPVFCELLLKLCHFCCCDSLQAGPFNTDCVENPDPTYVCPQALAGITEGGIPLEIAGPDSDDYGTGGGNRPDDDDGGRVTPSQNADQGMEPTPPPPKVIDNTPPGQKLGGDGKDTGAKDDSMWIISS